MSFFRRRKEHSKNEIIVQEKTSLQSELIYLRDEFQLHRRMETKAKFVDRIHTVFSAIIAKESRQGNYEATRKGLILRQTVPLTDGDKLEIRDRIRNLFSDFYVSMKFNSGNDLHFETVDVLMRWKDATDGEALQYRLIADAYNKQPILKDDLMNAEPVEPIEDILEHIIEQLKSNVSKYGVVLRSYTYTFLKPAETDLENSEYRATMSRLIDALPVEFHSVRGTFQRTSKMAIVAFTIEFVIDL